MSISDLKWLIGDSIVGVEHLDESGMWVLRFESNAVLSIECMWRIIENGILSVTSHDHGHQFGLPKPFDSVAALGQLVGSVVTAVTVREGTADITLQLGEHLSLEVVATSAGYESWCAVHPKLGKVFASSGGQLNVMGA